MNLPRVCAAAGCFALGLLFYAGYRSPATCSNRVMMWLMGEEPGQMLQQWVLNHLPLPTQLTGCLPSALWVLAATSLVGGWQIAFRGGRIVSLALAPFAINALWEVVQWTGLTDGHADLADALAGLAGWGLAMALPFERPPLSEPVDSWVDPRLLVLVIMWALMGFADIL